MSLFPSTCSLSHTDVFSVSPLSTFTFTHFCCCLRYFLLLLKRTQAHLSKLLRPRKPTNSLRDTHTSTSALPLVIALFLKPSNYTYSGCFLCKARNVEQGSFEEPGIRVYTHRKIVPTTTTTREVCVTSSESISQ